MENSKRDSRATQDPQPSQDLSSSIESVLKHAGDMGRYQRLLFIGMLPFGFGWAFAYFGQMFLTATPQAHWCYVPELAELGQELRRNLSIPGAIEGEDWNRCRVYQTDWTTVLATLTPPPAGTPTEECQHGWEFLFDDIPYATVVSEREWVCGKANLVPWSQTIGFLGSAIGGLMWGRLADIFGRLPTLIAANVFGLVGGIGTTFTNGFWDFCVCRFLVGISTDTCFMMFYIIAMEYVGIKHRTWVANMSIAIFFGGGCLTLPFLALWIADWRRLSLVMALPMAVVLVTPFTVPESARWLASQGKVGEAVKMFKRFERINGTKIPKDVMDEFIAVASSTNEQNDGIRTLFKNPLLRMMMGILIVSFMSTAIVFDILIRLSESLGGDFFITFALASATELPSIGILVLLLDRFGRRMLAVWPIIIVSILSFTIAFVPLGVPSVALAVAARFFNNMTYNVLIQWIPELLPTSLRASGGSLVLVSTFAAVMLSPFVVYAERLWLSLPLMVAAFLSLMGGGLMLLLPETMGRPIPQTIADGEKLARTQWLMRRSKAEDDNVGSKKTSTENIESS